MGRGEDIIHHLARPVQMATYYRVLVSFVLLTVILTPLAFGQSTPPDPESPYPILFIHGLNSSSETWETALDAFDDVWGQHIPVNASGTVGHECHAVLNAYGDMTARLGPDGAENTMDDDVLIPGVTQGFTDGSINDLASGSLYTLNLDGFWNEDPSTPRMLIDNSGNPGGLLSSESAGNESSIVKSGFALKACIDLILAKNSADRVILVGHSMGGLVAREYLQRTIRTSAVNGPDNHRVALLVTIGTPHRGSQTFEVQDPTPPRSVDESKGAVALPYSEAIRDLRYWYRSENAGRPTVPGLYLFGGNEDDPTFRSIPFNNFDVDADGDEDSAITGINAAGAGTTPWNGNTDNPNMPLPTAGIRYVWIASTNDSIVEYRRQFISLTGPDPSLEIQVISTGHLSQTGDVPALTNGLDEPDTRDAAYEIREETLYAGHISSRSNDSDWYRVTASEPAILRLFYETPSTTSSSVVSSIQVTDAQGALLGSSFVNGTADTLEVAVEAGEVYLHFAGPRQLQPESYNFRVELDTTLQVDIRSADAALRLVPGYPYVTASVDVTQGGAPLNTLSGTEFFVDENGQAVPFFTVTPPSQGGTRLADIVFIVDNSGSMGGEQADVENNIRAFVDQLAQENVDFALGLVRYGGENSGFPILEDNGTLTRDADYFKDSVLPRNRTGGGFEPGYNAITTAVNNVSFRTGSQKVFIIATDETPAQGLTTEAQALAALQSADVTLYASTTTNLFSTFNRLARPTGGAVFDIFADFSSVAQAITSQVSSTYVVTYRSPRIFGGGTASRELVIGVTLPDAADSDTTQYNPGQRALAATTPATQSVAQTGRPANTPQPIGVEVAQFAETPIESVQLFYRPAGSSRAYASAVMAENPDSTSAALKSTALSAQVFEADIPASLMQPPGVEYYIRISDGQITTSVPYTDPQQRPYQMAVLPNEPPQIDHRVPAFLTPGDALPIVATVTDSTSSLGAVTLFYRGRGEITYQTETMTLVDSVQYRADIPADRVTEDGVDYYIEAVDSPSGIAASRGNADQPISVGGASDSPTPRVPAEAAIGVPAAFSFQWDRVDGMTEYEMEVSSSRSFDQNVQRFADADTTVSVPALDAGSGYFWRVRSRALIGGFTPWSAPIPFTTYANELSVDINQSFNQAEESSDYRLVGVAGNASMPIGPILSGEVGTDWTVYTDTGADRDFLVEFDGSNTFSFRPGNGFWMVSASPWSLSTPSAAAFPINETGTATIPLQDGWNIISNPFDRDLDWSRVQDANGEALQGIWRFDGRFSRSDVFPSAASGEAVYFLNDSGRAELVLPYSVGLTYTPPPSTDTETVQFFALDAYSSLDGLRSTVEFGQTPEARSTLDALDLVGPPGAFERASLRSIAETDEPAKARTGRARSLVRDVRPAPVDGYVYELQLDVREPHPVALSARHIDQLAAQAVVLVVPTTGERFDLQQTPTVTIYPRKNRTPLQLLVGDASFVEQTSKMLTPAELAFHAPYPNPIQAHATLSFALPETERVRIEAYDILGRRVAILTDKEYMAGTHTLTWTPDAGLASGVYLLRFATASGAKTRKVSLIR